MLFFLLLCQLFGLPAVLAGAWDFVTGFLMPAAAILSSGALAVWLQRRDHQRQADARAAEDDKREAADLRKRQAGAIERASHVHKTLTSLGYPHDDRDMTEAIRLLTLTGTEWVLTGLPEARWIGSWMFNKRAVAVRHVAANAPGLDVVSRLQVYFMDVHSILEFWMLGAIDGDWFKSDLRRLRQAPSTIAAEEAEYLRFTDEQIAHRSASWMHFHSSTERDATSPS
ncbi:hypothetical protein [Clavibacter nebraskensis]|uniref:hypothetical protein n=1 Tax=Clavibacter nebraskensis TaxID=31963 RepID=UPI00200ECF94|nr:hypothetical protein [Clavibacter nebraskensis]UQB14596.1 hypothetical protein LIX20_001218 [Clavibacter nebraskensis]UQB17428.1 hypothetical protein LIX22_001217 [Clavibacter nebraskensis]